MDLTTLLQLITRRAAELVGAHDGRICLWDEDAQVLVSRWPPERADERVRFRLGEGVIGTVAQRRTGMIVNDSRTWPDAHLFVHAQTGITAVVAEPLTYRDRLVGVLSVNGEGTERPSRSRDGAIISLFAAEAAVAIENARLYDALKAQRETLRALSAKQCGRPGGGGDPHRPGAPR